MFDKVFAVMAGIAKSDPIPPKNIPGHSESDFYFDPNEKDEIDSSFEPRVEKRRSAISSFVMCIAYTDAEGVPSQRQIAVISVTEKGRDFYVYAKCYLRNSTRTFLLSRISEVHDFETGEVFTDVEGYFEKYGLLPDHHDLISTIKPNKKAKTSPASETYTLRLLKDHASELAVLTYLARSDGHLHILEVDCIIDYCSKYLSKNNKNFSSKTLRKYIKKLWPCREAFEEGVKQMCLHPERIQAYLFSQAATKLITSDKEVHPEEEKFIAVLNQCLSEADSH